MRYSFISMTMLFERPVPPLASPWRNQTPGAICVIVPGGASAVRVKPPRDSQASVARCENLITLPWLLPHRRHCILLNAATILRILSRDSHGAVRILDMQ